MTATPVFTQVVRNAYGQVTATNTNRDGTGTTVLLFTPGSNGSRVERIVVTATGTTTAGMVRFYLSTDSGTTKRLWKEIAITAIVPSASVSAFTSSINTALASMPLLMLPSGTTVYVSTHNTETFNVFFEGGDY